MGHCKLPFSFYSCKAQQNPSICSSLKVIHSCLVFFPQIQFNLEDKVCLLNVLNIFDNLLAMLSQYFPLYFLKVCITCVRKNLRQEGHHCQFIQA